MAKKPYKPASTNAGTVEPRQDEDEKPEKLTEIELLAIVDGEINGALGKMDTKLSNSRLQAMKYYLGDPVGNLAPPEAEGRSAVISMDVADTIEWILPSLLRIFTSGDKAVEFAPRKIEDAQGAQQATDWANYVFTVQNNGFLILHDFFKDALLQKLGVVKSWWDDSKDITTEEYTGLTPDELTVMLQDGEVEVIQQTARMDDSPQPPAQGGGMPTASAAPPASPMVYDVKVKRTAKTAHTCIENVPPEEFLFSRKARSPDRIFSCHHRVLRTVTELREAGYKNTDRLENDDGGAEFSQEAIERASDTNEFIYGSQFLQPADPTMRFVWITESYLQVDWNGDGLAEWRKVVKSGKVLLSNDEIEEHPFSMITPIKMPHKLVGRSIADLLMDLQDIKTALLRQFIDNMYLRNNGRTYVDENQNVNIDDLLDNRVGGIVRGKGPNGITPIITPELSPQSFNLLEYLDQIKEGRTGVNSTFQGLDADTLNKTATGVNQLVSAAQSRIELIARIFAETGVKDIFRKILKNSAKYQDKAQVVRLTNGFVTVDPRAWKTQYDIIVNVGLGTGNKDQIAAHVMGIMQIQEKALEGGLPICGPKEVYNAAAKFAVNTGFKNPDEFFIDPESQQGQQLAAAAQQKPDPKMAEVQAKTQYEQQKLGFEGQKFTAEMQAKQQEQAGDWQIEKYRIDKQIEADLLKHQISTQAENDRAKLNADVAGKPTTTVQFDTQGAMEGAAQALILAAQSLQEIGMAQSKMATEQTMALQNTQAGLMQALQAMTMVQTAPKNIKVTRGKDGSLHGEIQPSIN